MQRELALEAALRMIRAIQDVGGDEEKMDEVKRKPLSFFSFLSFYRRDSQPPALLLIAS